MTRKGAYPSVAPLSHAHAAADVAAACWAVAAGDVVPPAGDGGGAVEACRGDALACVRLECESVDALS
jgi:hypothetical protein